MSNSPNTRKYLTEDELKRLLHIIKGSKSARDEAIFLVTYWRGLRASEVGRIPFSAWNQSKRRLFVTYGMYNLGTMYEAGCGVVRNLAEARNWYMRAAQLDNEQAKEALQRLRQ